MQPQIFASQSDKILEAVDVVESERRDDANYFAKELVKSTTRLNLTSRQTPQSLTVLTEARLKDQGIKDYQVLLRNVPGVTLNKWDERVYPTARGFAIDYYLLDSMPSFGGFSLGANDMSLLPYERVEVVKGANGLLAGAGNPAASLNFIRKRADSKELKGNFGISAGSYDRYVVNGDVQTPVNESGSVRARLSFTHEKSHSYMDYYNRKNSAIYGVVDSDIGDNSWLSLGAFYQELRRHGVRWGGMPAFYSDGSRTNFSKNEIFSQPWTRWDIKTLDFYADFKHYFENEASLNLSYSFRRANTDSNLLYYGGAVNLDGTGNIGGLSAYANKREENIHNVDAYANIPYEIANLSHEFVFGAMYNNYKKSSDKVSSYWLQMQRTTPAGLAYTARSRIDFKNLHLDDPKFPYEDQNNKDKTIQKAFYAANKLSITDELKFLLGARVSYYKYKIEGGKDNRNFTNEITPYLGITYDIGANHTLYASYTSIFKPQSVKDANDKYLDPIQGKDYEVGIKGEYLDGALQASLGVFKIVQDKLGIDTGKINPATNAKIYESGKGVTSKGVELDLNGEITKNLSLSFGATHFNAKDANGEKYATDSSRSTANLFAKYEFRDFRVGAGAMYKSKIYKDADEITQKGYTLANLMLGYKFAKNFDVQLNIDNLFNKKYYEGIGKNMMVYGDPRTFNLSFNYNF